LIASKLNIPVEIPGLLYTKTYYANQVSHVQTPGPRKPQQNRVINATMLTLSHRWKTQLLMFSGRRGSFIKTPSWWGRWTTPKSGNTNASSFKPFTSKSDLCRAL